MMLWRNLSCGLCVSPWDWQRQAGVGCFEGRAFKVVDVQLEFETQSKNLLMFWR